MNGTRAVGLAAVATVAVTVSLAVSTPSVAALQDKTVWDGIYTEAQAKRGDELYKQRCVSCHGADLGGSELAPSLAGTEFAANWNDLPLSELSERIRVTMPQDQPGVLTRAQSTDLLAYMLSKGGFPTGSDELSAEPGALNSVKFLLKKP
jgi:mono/diheme cytochrome c family protein